MLLKCCTQYASNFGKVSSGLRTKKRAVFIPIPKKSNVKECSNYSTIVLISHISNIMIKILQARLQQSWSEKFPMHKLGFKELEVPESRLSMFTQSLRKQGNSRKTSTSIFFFIMLNSLTVWITINCGKFLERRVPDYCVLTNLYVGQEVTE